MDKKIICPKCHKSGFWTAKDNRLKCKNCRHIFTLKPNSLNIPENILREIVFEFLSGHSTNIMLKKIDISKYKLLKTLTSLRLAMVKDIPDNLRPMIKLDSENLQSKEKIKSPIIGIFYKEEKVYAKILSNLKPNDLKNFLKEKKSAAPSEKWQKYIGLAFKGRLYRLNPDEKKKHCADALEKFWKYLKQNLSARGGVRKEKLPLYLGEYAWRYNNQGLVLKNQEEKLLKLLIINS